MTASPWRTLVRLTVASSLVLAAACTPADPPTPIVPKGDDGGGGDDFCPPPCSLDGTPPAPWDNLTWEFTEVDVGNPTLPAGVQNRMVRKPNGDIHVAYFKSEESVPSCDIAAFGGGPGEVPVYDLKVATLLNGATDWTVESISLLHLDEPGHATARYGIDATLNNAGQMVIVLAAGGVSLFQCGSTDVVTCTQGATWNCQAAVADSTGCCPERTDMGGNLLCDAPCLQWCDAMQNACRTGSTVGAWTAIAAADNGTLGIAYTDTHNAAVQDAQDNQGLEFTEGGGSTGIRPWSGQGKYTAMAYNGNTPIAAFTHFHRGGLSILSRPAVTSGGNDWLDPEETSRIDAWDGFEIGERIRLENAPDGTLGLLFHAFKDRSNNVVNDLVYCTSDDGAVSWNFPCNKGLASGHVGGYPSLAYDADSIPYVAYQYCGSSDCPASQDGLRMAWFEASTAKWWRFTVHNEASSRSGLYNQIVIDPATKEPTIAFQHLTRGSLVIARGRFN